MNSESNIIRKQYEKDKIYIYMLDYKICSRYLVNSLMCNRLFLLPLNNLIPSYIN